jgi:hypothetical protein
MFQINCKLKSLLYIVFGIFRLKIFFIQNILPKDQELRLMRTILILFLDWAIF